MINNFKKILNSNIFIFIAIFLMVSPIILSRSLNNLDEIWNYNFARNIADGLIPYKDFNMVTTPLLPFICGLILKLLGNELIIMRILACILISFIFFVIYLILKKCKINKYYIFGTLLLLFILLKEYFCIDYNFAILFLTLILIYLELTYFLKNTNYFKGSLFFHFFIGLLSGCCILLKQSTGLMISCISIFYPILLLQNKINFKLYLKIASIRILGILIPILLLFTYLLFNNAIFDFIDYTILGIKTFTNSIPYTNLIFSKNIAIKILSIFIPIFIVVNGIYLWIKREKKLFSFYTYALASLVVIFPISDDIHFLIGITPFFLLASIFLFYYIKVKLNKNIKLFFKELLKCFTILILIIYFIVSFILFGNYFNNADKNHPIKHYFQIPISEQLLDKIEIIDQYLLQENYPIYILDAEAAIYMISINKYNKNFDMFNKGNLGSKSENGIIEKIKQFSTGTKLLIKNDNYLKNWQTPFEVINFVKNNFNKIGEVSIFDIYEINAKIEQIN